MPKALVLYAHPCPESFCGALHGAVTGALADRGWEVDDCDLYAEGFQPVLTAEERRGYHDVGSNLAPVQGYVERLRAAEALVLVFPVWNFGYPAILKGFFDRVFLPGVSFTLADGRLSPALTHVRKLAAVTTYGATRLSAVLAGDPPRRLVTRALRYTCAPETLRYLALYDMNRADAAQRAAFLARASREMEAL
ncbi:flavodoxin family protein [Rhodobacteraceae bacterium CCMM004]|nr:flavodoxin family protein [Rhodobacteraceae bacterium CCMM004]